MLKSFCRRCLQTHLLTAVMLMVVAGLLLMENLDQPADEQNEFGARYTVGCIVSQIKEFISDGSPSPPECREGDDEYSWKIMCRKYGYPCTAIVHRFILKKHKGVWRRICIADDHDPIEFNVDSALYNLLFAIAALSFTWFGSEFGDYSYVSRSVSWLISDASPVSIVFRLFSIVLYLYTFPLMLFCSIVRYQNSLSAWMHRRSSMRVLRTSAFQ